MDQLVCKRVATILDTLRMDQYIKMCRRPPLACHWCVAPILDVEGRHRHATDVCQLVIVQQFRKVYYGSADVSACPTIPAFVLTGGATRLKNI